MATKTISLDVGTLESISFVFLFNLQEIHVLNVVIFIQDWDKSIVDPFLSSEKTAMLSVVLFKFPLGHLPYQEGTLSKFRFLNFDGVYDRIRIYENLVSVFEIRKFES